MGNDAFTFGELEDAPVAKTARVKKTADLTPFVAALTKLFQSPPMTAEFGAKSLPVTVGDGASFSTLRKRFLDALELMPENTDHVLNFRTATPGVKEVTKFYVRWAQLAPGASKEAKKRGPRKAKANPVADVESIAAENVPPIAVEKKTNGKGK